MPEAKASNLITVNAARDNTENQMTHFPFKGNLLIVLRAVLVLVNFGCFSSSRFSHFHCNAMRKAIEAP